MTDAVAARAGNVRGFGKCRTQTLARQLHEAEAGDLAQLHAGAVVFERFLQAILDFPLILRALHVDEVDDDQAAEVAQAQLPRDFLGGLEVGIERGRLDVSGLGRARGVDVDRHQRLGMVDDDCAA